jgi:hypothetical protein
MPLNLLNGISETQTQRTSASDLLLDEAMGSLLIVVPAIFALAFSFYLYKKINQIKLYRQTRGQDDDDLLMRRMESVGDELENGASANGNNDQYRKLRQIYRDIQEGAKAFLAAEYRMCVYFLIAFGSFISVFVSRTDYGWDFNGVRVLGRRRDFDGFGVYRDDDCRFFERALHYASCEG